MNTIDTLIIGAGLTGLSCAIHLQNDYLLLEKECEPGGVVRTTVTETRYGPFYCDGTGHWLHLRNPAMRALVEQLLPGELVEHERNAVISLHGVFTPYPFQANTYGLPREIVLDCLLGLLKAKHPEDFGLPAWAGRPANFRESVERLFGEGICRHFMVPYNEKLLGVSLQEISPEYADRFIPQPSLEDVIKGALGFSREALGYNARFVYPREGGIGALPRALADALPIPPRYQTSVAKIDSAAKTATLTTGETIAFDHLVNTMPLPRLLEMLAPLPVPVQEAFSRLRATTVHYYDIGVRGKGAAASAHHWTYFPETDYIFYRVGSYSAVHASCTPAGCRSYYVEMSGGIEELRKNPDALQERVLADLRKAEILAEDDEILFTHLRQIPFAYVIFDEHYVQSRDTILAYLAESNIQTAGRWGGWNYGGMEDAMIEGKQAALAIRG